MSVPSPLAAQDGFALTPVQAGMIFETLAHQDPSVNLEQVVIHLEDEAVDATRMAEIWTEAIARHAALRLAFRQDASGRLLQFVDPPFAAPLQVEDWTGLANHEQALADRLAGDRVRGVDLSVSGSWRLALLHLAPRRAVLIWSFSHSILDGRSFRAVLEEVFAAYDGQGRGDFQTPTAFRDHAEGLAQADKTDAKAFFAAYLEGFDRPTPLGFSAPDALNSGATSTIDALLDAADTTALHARAADAGVSFATMVQAAWGMVLARISGQAEAVFGVTRSGRYLTPGGAQMLGCLITTQPLRLRLSADLTLNTLLANLRADLHAQRPYEGLGLPDIASATGLERGAALFDSLVMVERQSLHAALQAQGGPWGKRRVDLHEKGAMPLTLAAYGDACLQLRLEHMPGRIGADDAARYLDYVTRLLVSMAHSAPEVLLRDLDMMPANELASLKALAQPAAALPAARPTCIADAFEAAVLRYPDAPALALVGLDAVLDFAGLDRRANQLAQTLAQWGIGAGAVLGLCLPRGPDFVALVLASAKLGAVFVPMDPSYPADTLHHMATDSAAAMIVAHKAAPWMADLPVTLLTEDLGRDAPTSPPSRQGLSADRAAYVIYTSGTTGKPKGVVISQHAFVAHACAAIAAYDLSPSDRVLQFAALSFDVALEEIVPTLLAGATLVLRDEGMIVSPQAFAEAVADEGITVLNLPTGFWQVLLAGMEAGTAHLPDSLRLMIVGGERMPPDAVARWHALPAMPKLINGYGPTEATITCAAHHITGPVRGPEVPVGRAFGHATLYLRAADGSLAPKGALAELWVGGDAVASGYLNQPDLTAARFAASPFGPGRLYRSGDMGYWTAEDVLVIAGRADRQIKLRGFRIEPAEVEALLETVPGVAQAHVGLVTAGGARLVGWMRPSDRNALPDIEGIRAYVATQLPAPKRPELLFVTDWPQTAGGKTDVKRLPVPQHLAQPQRDLGRIDPQTNRIAEIFATVLGVDAPGPHESFFDLGGHSLQLLTLIGHIEAAFSTRLTVAQVHGQPTPQGLAALLSGPVKIAPGADLFDCLMPIQPLGTGVPLYGVHVLGVNGSFFRPLAKAMGLDQPIFGLTVGLLSADTPLTVEDTAALYFQAIQAHRPTGPIGLVAVSLGSYIALELAQQLVAKGRDVRLLAMMDASGPGGRGKIRGRAWVRAHLALLRSGGLGYARALFAAKMEGLRHRLEKIRLSAGKYSANGAALKSVDGFVAANAVAIQNYAPQPYAGRMTIIRAGNSVFDSDAAVAGGLGWADVAQGGFDIIDVPGDHLSILEEPGVWDVANALTGAMTQQDGNMIKNSA